MFQKTNIKYIESIIINYFQVERRDNIFLLFDIHSFFLKSCLSSKINFYFVREILYIKKILIEIFFRIFLVSTFHFQENIGVKDELKI